VKQGTAALVIALAIISPAVLAAQTTDPIRVTLSLNRTTAAPGDSLRATIVVTNTSPDTTGIRWLSGQLYDFVLVGPRGRELWSWGSGMAFDQAIHPRDLAPGQQLVYSELIPMPRSPGTYRVVGNLTTQPVRSASALVTVN